MRHAARRRAFTPTLDAMPGRIAPTTFAPIADPGDISGMDYIELAYGSWEQCETMDSFCDPIDDEDMIDMLD